MNINIILTAVSSICSAISCIVALVLGVYNIVHSRKYEELQHKRETRDKALDAALQLCANSMRVRNAKNLEEAVTYMPQVSALCIALAAYGYRVDIEIITHDTNDGKDAAHELGRLMSAIVVSAK
ncbi:hypothetical protein H3U87_06715 [Bifidobacterium sp. W8101]|uniref:hypothetical protein n=1 Tax=Bifidobacterium TaxID=1678 RepID=UPI0018DB84E9|nr:MULTISPECIES: hypothetical protein [Bifidobacterium]MBI0126814.1 hypothetical protein [Bifidobacterium choladohabitans]MBI0128383.1 hypothetical protein [Bifidobacterium sp. W8103]MBI0138970.1 hypothetical protein [Bifidobacterium sp. W8105]